MHSCSPLASPIQVVELTAQLQALTDARLAWEMHQQEVAGASQAARDRRLAAAIGDTCDDGPSSREVEALAQSLPEGSSQGALKLHLAFAAAVEGEELGRAGCGALVSAGGALRTPRGLAAQHVLAMSLYMHQHGKFAILNMLFKTLLDAPLRYRRRAVAELPPAAISHTAPGAAGGGFDGPAGSGQPRSGDRRGACAGVPRRCRPERGETGAGYSSIAA